MKGVKREVGVIQTRFVLYVKYIKIKNPTKMKNIVLNGGVDFICNFTLNFVSDD